MEEEQNDGDGKTTAFLFPPGCRFYPSEEEILSYYLANKTANSNGDDGYNLIKELDLYDFEPQQLPENACYAYGFRGRKRHCFCYCKARVREENRRKAKNGYWRRTGTVKKIMAVNRGEKSVLGTRKGFVFYLGNSLKSVVRTDWVLYEYQLLDHVKSAFVICRVFLKSRSGHGLSEMGISSAMEESASAVRHVGVQCDGSLTSSLHEAESHDEEVKDGALPSQIDNHVIQGPIPVVSFRLPVDTTSKEQVIMSELNGGAPVDTLTTQQLLSILEDDFIELDDLVP